VIGRTSACPRWYFPRLITQHPTTSPGRSRPRSRRRIQAKLPDAVVQVKGGGGHTGIAGRFERRCRGRACSRARGFRARRDHSTLINVEARPRARCRRAHDQIPPDYSPRAKPNLRPGLIVSVRPPSGLSDADLASVGASARRAHSNIDNSGSLPSEDHVLRSARKRFDANPPCLGAGECAAMVLSRAVVVGSIIRTQPPSSRFAAAARVVRLTSPLSSKRACACCDSADYGPAHVNLLVDCRHRSGSAPRGASRAGLRGFASTPRRCRCRLCSAAQQLADRLRLALTRRALLRQAHMSRAHSPMPPRCRARRCSARLSIALFSPRHVVDRVAVPGGALRDAPARR